MINSARLSRKATPFLPLLFALVIGLAVSPPGHADPGDFGAMPGLWKMVFIPVSHGKPGKAVVQWHCIDEGADPWEAFVSFQIPETTACQRDAARRGSTTSLAWRVSCAGKPSIKGEGRVDFDSAEHYTGSVVLDGRGEVIRISGQRRAACTSPSD